MCCKNENEEVLLDAYLISHFQTGLKNVLDRAVLKYREITCKISVEKLSRRLMKSLSIFRAA